MHTAANIIHRHQCALLGSGFNQNVRNYACAHELNREWITLPPPLPDVPETASERMARKPSPWGLRRQQTIDKAKDFLSTLKLPRSWENLQKRLLKPRDGAPNVACKLKAHMAITATTSGLLSLLGAWTKDASHTKVDRPKYATYLGDYNVGTTGATLFMPCCNFIECPYNMITLFIKSAIILNHCCNIPRRLCCSDARACVPSRQSSRHSKD